MALVRLEQADLEELRESYNFKLKAYEGYVEWIDKGISKIHDLSDRPRLNANVDKYRRLVKALENPVDENDHTNL